MAKNTLLSPCCLDGMINFFVERIGNPLGPNMAGSIGICPYLAVRTAILRRILQRHTIKTVRAVELFVATHVHIFGTFQI